MKPGNLWMILLALFCIPALIYILYNDLGESAAAYPVYLLSAYTLFIWVIFTINIVKRVRAAIYGHHLGRRYMTDLSFRGHISLHTSTGINLFYSLLKLGAAIYTRSLWFGAIAVYYLILTLARALLLRSTYNKKADLRHEYQASRMCGCLLFALNLALSVMTVQMVVGGKGYEYPGYMIFVMAGYAFYAVAAAIADLIRYRKLHSPVLSASKVLGFSTALVSMLSLQTAMFAAFGGKYAYQRLMNSITGGVVCLLIFLMAALMVARASMGIRKMRD